MKTARLTGVCWVSVLLLYCSLYSPLFSQDNILLISGQTIEGKILSAGDDTIRYTYLKKGKSKEGFVEAYRVFSLQYQSGEEKVIYMFDSLTANDRTVAELRNFIIGEQDAILGYRPFFTTAFSFLISGTAAFLLDGSFVIIVVPFITYMSFIMLNRPGIDRSTIRDPKLLSNPDYLEGYKRIAKNKKNRNALWGSLIGAGVGYGVFLLAESGPGF